MTSVHLDVLKTKCNYALENEFVSPAALELEVPWVCLYEGRSVIERAGWTRSSEFEEDMEKRRLPEQGIKVILHQ